MPELYSVKVEEARPATHEKPSAGPVYRCIYAKDALTVLPSHFESPWEFFRSLSLIHSIPCSNVYVHNAQTFLSYDEKLKGNRFCSS